MPLAPLPPALPPCALALNRRRLLLCPVRSAPFAKKGLRLLSVLRHPAFRKLFLAQMVALVGTGIATVALALLAFDLTGAGAGQVLGTVLAMKMVIYVVVAPVAAALVAGFDRRTLLVALEGARAGIALCLPFVSTVWQVYTLMALLYAASAIFTPAFQATLPDVLEEEEAYTNALSLSRLAFDLESLVSPLLAAAFLLVLSFGGLFTVTAIGFVASAGLLLATAFPAPASARPQERRARVQDGIRQYLKARSLRFLLALSLTSAAAGAMVIVNTVVYVRSVAGLPEGHLALTLAAFGAGSMAMALALPRLLRAIDDEAVMLAAGVCLCLLLALGATLSLSAALSWPVLLALWFSMGLGFAAIVTPAGRLLRRAGDQAARPPLFAAHFALSHACWLVAYPLAGTLGAAYGLSSAFAALGALSLLGLGAAVRERKRPGSR